MKTYNLFYIFGPPYYRQGPQISWVICLLLEFAELKVYCVNSTLIQEDSKITLEIKMILARGLEASLTISR